VDLADARSVLGVSASDDWQAVRRAYRSLMRTTHPDVAGASGEALSVRVNEAYRTLAIARREGRLGTGEAAPAPATRPASVHRREHRRPARPVVDDVRIEGADTLVLSSTPAESFRRLVEATHALGELSYVDRSAAIFEAIFALEDGSHASFVVSLQWRAHDATCEAFCTLEALDRAESLDVSGVLEQLAPFIPPDPGNVDGFRG
jgi:hypothetical protein